MTCPDCYGMGFRPGTYPGCFAPCEECSGMGSIHCCDGLQSQPMTDQEIDEMYRMTGTGD